MTGRIAILPALLVLARAALAEPATDHAAECRAAADEVVNAFPLPNVSQALSAKRLGILVVGAGSSVLPGAAGAKNAYPARLQAALTDRIPDLAVKVTTDVKMRRTAIDMVKGMPAALSAAKPALMIWQTGTVDAMQGIDSDDFSRALDQGINIARSAGADVILINAQYSPRTESMIALAAYSEVMRWAAVQHEVPLFNRFAIMRSWADQGTFDFFGAPNKLDIAERVHDCIGRLLAGLVIEAAKPEAAPGSKDNGAR